MKTDCDVVVIGLGPAGTLTSLLLSDSSIKVIGTDKEKEIYSLPRAVTIDDEGLRTLQRLNLENIYLENGTAIEGAYFLDDKLQKLSGMDVPAASPGERRGGSFSPCHRSPQGSEACRPRCVSPGAAQVGQRVLQLPRLVPGAAVQDILRN